MKPFLILQLRGLDGAADNEFEAFLKYGNLKPSEVHRIRMEKESFANLDPTKYAGVIVGGGPSNVSDEEISKPLYQQRFEHELASLYSQIFEYDIPYLGSCYGLGSIVKFTGGLVSKERYSEEVGYVEVQLNEHGQQDPLLMGLADTFKAFCGHKEACQDVPKEAVLLASSEACPVQMIRFANNIYATQFHCELDAEGLAERIRFYKHHGYFEPHLADELIIKTKDVATDVPQMILRRFVDRYRTD
jgi:GMP synthase (glutamine-hydrolysing)